jgi:hypothetical protein
MIAALLLLLFSLFSPANATTSRSGSRFYTWGRGERYWSVTTILGALPKDALKFWAAKVVAEFAFDRKSTWLTMTRPEAVEWLKKEPLRFTNERANYGKAIHAATEAIVLQTPVRRDEFSDEEAKAIGHFFDFVETLRPRYLLTEASVYNRRHKYAGTLDAVVEVPYGLLLELAHGNELMVPWEPRDDRDVVTLILDTKTGGDVAEGKGVYPEVALQLAAYGRAEFVGAVNGQEHPLPLLDGAAVLHVNASGWRLVPVNIGPDPRLIPEGQSFDDSVFRSFLFVREVFRWREVVSKEVLGTPLQPDPKPIPETTATSSTAPAGGEPVVDETAPPVPAKRPAKKAPAKKAAAKKAPAKKAAGSRSSS